MRKRTLASLVLPALILASAGAAQAKPGDPIVYAQMHSGQPLSPKAIDGVVRSVGKWSPNHIVFLVHGYGDTNKDAREIYAPVVHLLHQEFAKSQQHVAVVGVQWDAAMPGNMVPWKAMGSYLKVAGRARAVGHMPMRQLMFALHRSYPRAQISIYSHSLGAEAAVACAYPETTYADTLAKSPAFQPQQPLFFNEVVLGQPDLDYDVFYKGKSPVSSPRMRAKMLWTTVSPYFGEREEVLQQRDLLRGKPAGSRFPRMTTAQYDALFKHRAVVFDGKNLQRQHQFIDFYNQDRVERLVGTANYLADPKAPEPREIAELDRVLEQPAQVRALLPYLDSQYLAARFYALWRIEGIVDGGSQHFADETIDKVDLLLRNKPREVWNERKTSKCKSIRNGYWPTEATMTRAGAPGWANKNK